ncbi:MAG: 3-hydroxyisobutyrate dehydrogenase [Actinomycetota bacterium]|nr:3-hydroxyisobutyrate dehydrogenase [Actinomycetota bacterium]
MRIGFIGTGSIGNPMAANLAAAGHELLVHDLRHDAAANLVEKGAIWCATPADAARDADAVLMSLPSHVEVESVCFGTAGVLSAIRPGTFLVDLTTISVSLLPRLIEATGASGVRYLASPVSQGVDNAHAGKLSIFVGGDRADLDACRSLFDAIATVVIHTGDHFSAISAKLLTNMLWYINAAAIGEALVLGAKSGIDLPTLREVIVNSCGTSWVADHDIPSVYDGSFDPTFTTKLCCKDLRLISELGTTLNVPIELSSMVEQIFRRAENLYGGDSPELSVVRQLQEITGTDLQLKARQE